MNTNKFIRFAAAIIACSVLGLPNSRGMMFYYDTYIIFDSGSGSTYYDALSDGGDPNWNSTTFSYNMLGGTLTLKGGDVYAYRDDDGNYWNESNTQTLNYAVYTSGSTPGFSPFQILAGGSGGSASFQGGNNWRAVNSSGSVNIGDLISSSGNDWRIAVYFSGNASYNDNGQQFFNMGVDSNGGANYVANVNAFYGATTTATQSAAFSGTGYFNFNGSGQTYTLDKANTYTGETQLDAGTVVVTGSLNSASSVFVGSGVNASDAALSLSGTTEFGNNVTVNPSTGSGTRTISKTDGTAQTMSGAVTLNRSATIDVADSSGNLTMSGVVSGTNALTKAGSGTLTFSGSSANTYSGTTTVNAGTLVLGKSGVNALAGTPTINDGGTIKLAAGNQFSGESTFLTINSGGVFDMNNFNETLAIQGTNGTVKLGSGTITINPTGTDSFAGSIEGTGAVFKTNTGTQVFGGSSSYTGATTVGQGILVVAHANALGATNGSTTVSDGAILSLSNATSMTVAESFMINGTTGDGSLQNVGGNNTISGNITLGVNSRIGSSGGGSLILSGAVNGTNRVLYVGGANNTTISGVLSGTGNSEGGTTTSLYKDGAGTLTLSGNNTYSGDTRVVVGTLTVASGGNLGNGTSDVFVSAGANVNVNANVEIASLREAGVGQKGTNTIGAGATLTVSGNDYSALSTSIRGEGNLIKSGTGTMILIGTQDRTGTTTVSNGKLVASNALSTSALTINGGTFETVGANFLGDSASVTLSGGTFALGGNDQIGSFEISGGTLSGASTLTASSYALNGGTVNAGLGAGAVTVATGTTELGSAGRLNSESTLTVNSGQLTLGGNEAVSSLGGSGGTLALGANNLSVGSGSFGGLISGVGGILTKTGSGSLTLSGDNSYTGGTFLNGGELIAGHASAFGTGGITVGTGTTLNFSNFNVANIVTNNGGTVLSSGVLNDVDAEAGETTIGGAGSSVSTVAGTAVVNVNAANVTISNVTGGTVNASNDGLQVASIANSATVNVSGANARIAAMSGGSVNASAAGLVVTNFNGGNIAVSNGVTVGLRSGSSSGVISGAGGIAKQGATTLTLSGVNTYSGATTVEAGKLIVNGSITNSDVTVQSGAVLAGSGSLGDTTILSGATIAPGNSPGIQSIIGDLTWSGGASYDWEIFNYSGTAGTDWDLITVSGNLLFTNISALNPFSINLISLFALPDTQGPLAGWDPLLTNSWTILTATNGIVGFDASFFTLNLGSFTNNNSLGTGLFSLASDGNNLNLLFDPNGGVGPEPIPEPGTWAAAALLAGAAGYVRWRRRKEQSKDA
jgi:fibronectin-binding autotransporter adhesin